MAAAARTSGGLGELAAEHGARLLVLPLDVTDPTAVRGAVDHAAATIGRDIVVDNAGIASYGFLEELTEEQARAQLEPRWTVTPPSRLPAAHGRLVAAGAGQPNGRARLPS